MGLKESGQFEMEYFHPCPLSPRSAVHHSSIFKLNIKMLWCILGFTASKTKKKCRCQMSRKAWRPSKSGRLIMIPHWVPSTCILLTAKIVDVADDKVSPSLGKATYWCGPDSYLSGSVTVLNGSSIAVSTIIWVFYKAVSVLLPRKLLGLAQFGLNVINSKKYV